MALSLLNRRPWENGQEYRLTQTALVVGGAASAHFQFIGFGDARTQDEEFMKNDCQAVLIRRVWADLVGPSLRAVFFMLSGLVMFSSTTAFGQTAYAVEFNQTNNLFGIINLLNGSFTQLGSEGSTLFNDIAAVAQWQSLWHCQYDFAGDVEHKYWRGADQCYVQRQRH